MDCLRRMSVPSWPDLFVQSKWWPCTCYCTICPLPVIPQYNSAYILSYITPPGLPLNYGAKDEHTVNSGHPSWITPQRTWFVTLQSLFMLNRGREKVSCEVYLVQVMCFNLGLCSSCVFHHSHPSCTKTPHTESTSTPSTRLCSLTTGSKGLTWVFRCAEICVGGVY